MLFSGHAGGIQDELGFGLEPGVGGFGVGDGAASGLTGCQGLRFGGETAVVLEQADLDEDFLVPAQCYQLPGVEQVSVIYTYLKKFAMHAAMFSWDYHVTSEGFTPVFEQNIMYPSVGDLIEELYAQFVARQYGITQALRVAVSEGFEYITLGV